MQKEAYLLCVSAHLGFLNISIYLTFQLYFFSTSFQGHECGFDRCRQRVGREASYILENIIEHLGFLAILSFTILGRRDEHKTTWKQLYIQQLIFLRMTLCVGVKHILIIVDIARYTVQSTVFNTSFAAKIQNSTYIIHLHCIMTKYSKYI